MKLKYKILLGFAALSVTLLFIEGYTLVFLNRTNHTIGDIVEKKFNTEKLVQQANLGVIQIHSDIWDAMLFGEEIRTLRTADIKRSGSDFYDAVRTLRDLLPEKKNDFETLTSLFREYFQFGSRILQFDTLGEFHQKAEVVEKFKVNKIKLIALLDETVAESSQAYERSLMTLRQDFQQMTMLIALLTGVMILLAVGMSLFVAGALTRPVEALMTAIKAFETGDLDARADVQTRDELGKLAAAFNTMGGQLKESIRQREEQERLRREMELAQQIQTAILPKRMDHPDFDIEAVMLPADEVGGDYYDVLTGKDGHLWLGIGDVSGHGMTPGLIMMMAQTIHSTIAGQRSVTPRDVMIGLNAVLYHNIRERLGADHFMTFTTLRYMGDGLFQHAGAHLDLLVYRKAQGICERIDTNGTWLNFIPDISHATSNAEFTIEIGDTLVLYTDGLTEAHQPGGEILDIDRFTEIVERHAAEEPAVMRDAILKDVLTWSGQQRLDDMSLLLARRVH